LWVEWPGHVISTWRLHSVTGALLAEGRLSNGPIDISTMPTGILLLELRDSGGERALLKVVRE
ncbi:MAG: hypothetical protein WAT74_15165, partial [Flavobacteriales bacterium]